MRNEKQKDKAALEASHRRERMRCSSGQVRACSRREQVVVHGGYELPKGFEPGDVVLAGWSPSLDRQQQTALINLGFCTWRLGDRMDCRRAKDLVDFDEEMASSRRPPISVQWLLSDPRSNPSLDCDTQRQRLASFREAVRELLAELEAERSSRVMPAAQLSFRVRPADKAEGSSAKRAAKRS